MKPTPERVPSSAEAAWLLHGSPRAVLGRIVPEDPLGLRARVAARIAGQALLFDLDRALLRVQASVALRAGAWRGEPELGVWLEERIDEALTHLLDEGQARADTGAGLARLCDPLGLDGTRLEAACRRFNRLPLDSRRAFFALVLEGAHPDGLARANGLVLGELARRARAALGPFRALAPGPSAGRRA